MQPDCTLLLLAHSSVQVLLSLTARLAHTLWGGRTYSSTLFQSLHGVGQGNGARTAGLKAVPAPQL